MERGIVLSGKASRRSPIKVKAEATLFDHGAFTHRLACSVYFFRHTLCCGSGTTCRSFSLLLHAISPSQRSQFASALVDLPDMTSLMNLPVELLLRIFRETRDLERPSLNPEQHGKSFHHNAFASPADFGATVSAPTPCYSM